MRRLVSQKRSLVKAVTYRILIMVMDFTTIYLFTGGVRVAIGFMLASSIYTSLAYIFHERIRARIGWESIIFEALAWSSQVGRCSPPASIARRSLPAGYLRPIRARC